MCNNNASKTQSDLYFQANGEDKQQRNKDKCKFSANVPHFPFFPLTICSGVASNP